MPGTPATVTPVTIKGSIALVTGAGSGIGRATALALAEKGATVLCADIRGEAAEKTAAECGERGAVASTAYTVDVRDRDAMVALAAKVEAEHGPVDIVINNAGVGMSGEFLAMSEADWQWIRSINLDGVINGCAAFGPGLIARQHGQVVNLSSGLGYTPTATEPGYVTTKAAVLAFSQCLRADWGRSGVGVTAICPGVINTPIIDRTRFVGSNDDPETKERTKKVFRRGHKPEKVAAAIVEAIEKNRAVVPVGFESWLGWWTHKFAPIRMQQAVARRMATR